jgi:hypothetical protein
MLSPVDTIGNPGFGAAYCEPHHRSQRRDGEKHRLRVRSLFVATVIAFAWALGASGSANAQLNQFGIRSLTEGACCSGDELRGTRASIATPGDGDFTLGGTNIFSDAIVAANGFCGQCADDERQIQAGFTASNDQFDPCQSGALRFFVAILKNQDEVCHSLGTAPGGQTDRWGVGRDTSGNFWTASKNGMLISGSWNSLLFGQQVRLWAGGEIAASSQAEINGTETWGWFNDIANNPCCADPRAWQRQKLDGSWFTIQSSSIIKDSGWTVGDLPSWIASH